MNIKKVCTIALIGIFLSSNAAFCAEKILVEKNTVLSLKDCLNLALQNSPAIKKSRYNYGITLNDVTIAKSAFFPTIGLGTGYDLASTRSSRMDTNSNAYTAQANLNQLIFNFGKTNARIRMQKFYKIAAEYNFDDTVLDTVYTVMINYYGVLAAKANLDVERANVQINERNYQRTKAYFDEGIRSKIDLVNAEVNLSDSKVALVTAEKTYQNAIVQLNNSMYIAYAPEYEIENTEAFNFTKNIIPVNLEKISESKDLSTAPQEVSDAFLTSEVQKLDVLDDYKFKPFPYTFEEAIELANKNRPDLKSYKATVDAMKQALLYIKREYYPEIGLSAGYGFRDKYSTNSYSLGVTASTNINILQKKSEIDTGKLQVALAENEVEKLEQDIYFEVQNLYINMKQLEKQIPLLGVKVRQTLENFELADGRYAVGIGDYIQLQDAKVNYNNAQQSYVRTVYNYNVARANLEKAIGLQQEVTLTLDEDKKK